MGMAVDLRGVEEEVLGIDEWRRRKIPGLYGLKGQPIAWLPGKLATSKR